MSPFALTPQCLRLPKPSHLIWETIQIVVGILTCLNHYLALMRIERHSQHPDLKGDHSNPGAGYAPRHAQFALPQHRHDNSCCTSQADSPPGRFRLRFGNESESPISDNIDG
jgi:hypothetical protein